MKQANGDVVSFLNEWKQMHSVNHGSSTAHPEGIEWNGRSVYVVDPSNEATPNLTRSSARKILHILNKSFANQDAYAHSFEDIAQASDQLDKLYLQLLDSEEQGCFPFGCATRQLKSEYKTLHEAFVSRAVANLTEETAEHLKQHIKVVFDPFLEEVALRWDKAH